MAELDLFSQLENFEKESLAVLEAVADESGLQLWKTARLGKTSVVQQVFSRMKEASKEDRPKLGQASNKVRQSLEAALESRHSVLHEKALAAALESETLDITLPGRRPKPGRRPTSGGSGLPDGRYRQRADRIRGLYRPSRPCRPGASRTCCCSGTSFSRRVRSRPSCPAASACRKT